jgi:hypothetical protein
MLRRDRNGVVVTLAQPDAERLRRDVVGGARG